MESESCSEIVQQLIARLPWGHNLLILTRQANYAAACCTIAVDHHRVLLDPGITFG
jgi:hypothetical protein